jgi:hypothetical protein
MNLYESDYKIPIDGDWFLEDLYVFPKAYEQVYFLIFSLLPQEDEEIEERIKYAYSQFPWKGGYSAVNFYDKLKYTTSRVRRPKVISMQYASPGWIELSAILPIAVAVEKLIKSISNSICSTNRAYHEVYTGMQKRKLLRIEIKSKEIELEQKHAEFIELQVKTMANILRLEDVDNIHEKSGSQLKSLKILLSLYRRVRTLAKFQINGKTNF